MRFDVKSVAKLGLEVDRNTLSLRLIQFSPYLFFVSQKMFHQIPKEKFKVQQNI